MQTMLANMVKKTKNLRMRTADRSKPPPHPIQTIPLPRINLTLKTQPLINRPDAQHESPQCAGTAHAMRGAAFPLRFCAEQFWLRQICMRRV